MRRMAMKGCLLIFLCFVSPISGMDKILGDTVEFLETKDCKASGSTLVIERLKDSSSSQVAYHDGNVWKPASDYKDRMSQGQSVILNGTNMNDHGLYSLSCVGKTEETRVSLNVFQVSKELVEAVGETVRFPFHYATMGDHGRFVLEKDRQVVFELDFSGEKNTSWFEGRLSVSPGWKKRGDLTLTLRGVRLEDRGDYFPYIKDKNGERRRETLLAVRMEVRHPAPTTRPPPPPSVTPTQTATGETMGTGTIFSVTLNVLLFLAVVCLCLCLIYTKSNASCGAAGGGGPSADVKLELVTLDPPGSQVKEHPHVGSVV